MSKKYSLFSVYGIEAEYMIVDSKTLKVRAVADQVLKKLNSGKICNEVELGQVSISNELVNHVLEIKSTDPVPSLENLDIVFHESLEEIQEILKAWDCNLLSTSMNPWFDPKTETVLWPHGQNEIYKLYDKVFDCKGHGWANLQSIHINLPYQTESEFVSLHSAIRIVLPLIPFLSASSPFFEGNKGPLADNRLSFYEKNQEKVPSIIGNIIPENVNSFLDYQKILEKIYQDISFYDQSEILQNPWLNSRGAIPKFDVGAIEIRLTDIQESPYMDFTLISLIVEMIKFVLRVGQGFKEKFSDEYLRSVYDQSKEFSPQVNLSLYYELFGFESKENSFENLRRKLIEFFKNDIPKRYHEGLEILSFQGNLSQRLIKKELTRDLYKEILICLRKNRPFNPCFKIK